MNTQTQLQYGEVETVSIDDLKPQVTQVQQAQNQIVPQEKKADESNNPLNWGESKELMTAAKRLQSLMPGGKKLRVEDAAMVAQYASIMDANPFRGEVYAFEKGGQVSLVESYQLLTRIAKRQSDYVTRYVPLTPDERKEHGVVDGAIAMKCLLLRDDRKHLVKDYVDMGFKPMEAFELVAESAVGVVLPGENINVAGWSRGQVAEKRAFKNVVKRAFAIPSPSEIRLEAEMMAQQGHMIQNLEQRAEHLEAVQMGSIEERKHLSIEQRRVDTEQRVNLLRGEVEEGID